MPEKVTIYNKNTQATVAVPAEVAAAWCAGPEGWTLAPSTGAKAEVPSKSAEQELAEREAAEAETAEAARKAVQAAATKEKK